MKDVIARIAAGRRRTEAPDEPLDGDASRLVRPYLLAAEREWEKAARRLFHTSAVPC
ncbi:hypothetical protein MTQ01_24530 [Streptomyces sp. XM4193]|uniref:hypothetical protein n=1 Tax=Streptomyces sp. XM4193 TaxID=2929782 RepID=UPI001FFC1D6B|nr:hypothetical protein [Streptomyces sp. XM4193]MCK1799137.1 hypothetical protein [Streptomyces sp. XM4193]